MVTEFICVSAFKVCVLSIGTTSGTLKCGYTTGTPATLTLESKEAAEQTLKAFTKSKVYGCEKITPPFE